MWFWLFVVGVVVFLLGGIVRTLQKRWRDLPHLVFNEVGGITAYCSVADFKRGSPAFGYVLAPDTIAFSNARAPHHHGRVIANSGPIWFRCAVRENSLFVPFASERSISYEVQAGMFVKPPENVDAYITEKMRANFAADFRLRFCKLVAGHNSAIDGTRVLAVIVTIIGAFAMIGGFLNRNKEEARNAPAVYYTTMEGSSEVTEIRGTQADLWKLPMMNPEVAGLDVMTGPVVDIMRIGGGLYYLCIVRQSDNHRICGFTAKSIGLRLADTGYLRFGSAKRWINERGNDGASSIWWAITEPEAQALVGKGYRLVK